MGIHVLQNFTCGGEWILQDALTNAPLLLRLLPRGTPLSTLRVVTSSRHDLRQSQPPIGLKPKLKMSDFVSKGQREQASHSIEADFSVLTAVLRAGRVGALTDHDSVCFPVDTVTGVLSEGRSNQVNG